MFGDGMTGRESLIPFTKPPSSIGLKPLDHPWVAVGEDEDADVMVYVECATPEGLSFAHVLFEADWGEREQADHIVKLHNDWLAARKESGLG